VRGFGPGRKQKMNTELIVFTGNTREEASKVLLVLQGMVERKFIKILGAAVLMKDAQGQVTRRETEDADLIDGALIGAGEGLLLGIPEGPVGMALGAAIGAITGGLAAYRMDLGFPNPFLKTLEDGLPPDSSVLLAFVEQEWEDRVARTVENFDGHVIRQPLQAEITEQLMQAKHPER
jgi:uncharacterized membrane protein